MLCMPIPAFLHPPIQYPRGRFPPLCDSQPIRLGCLSDNDNGFFRSILWDSIVRPQDYLCSYWLIPYCLFAVVAIFASCVGIEYIRQRLAALF